MANPKNAGRKPKLTLLEQIFLFQDYSNGADHVQVAYKYGVSVPTVIRILKKMKDGE